MATVNIEKTVNLDKTVQVYSLGSIYQSEANAHTFTITCTHGGSVVPLTGAVTGLAVLADSTTVPMTGKIQGGKAVLTLLSACYSVVGRIAVAIYNVVDGAETVIFAATGSVYRSIGEGKVAQTEAVSDLNSLLAEIATMRQATADAEQAVDNLDDLILVQETQPTSTTNKLWVKPESDEYKVPTWEEFEALEKRVEALEVT